MKEPVRRPTDRLVADFPLPELPSGKGTDSGYLPHPWIPTASRWERIKWWLIDFGWWPRPTKDDWRLANATVIYRQDKLLDQLVTELRTSRAVGPHIKERIAKAHALIVAERHYRWRE